MKNKKYHRWLVCIETNKGNVHTVIATHKKMITKLTVFATIGLVESKYPDRNGFIMTNASYLGKMTNEDCPYLIEEQ